MTLRTAAILLFAGAIGNAGLPQPASADLPALSARLERAVLEDDAAATKTVRGELLRMLSAGPPADRKPLVHYAVAYAGWRLSTNPSLDKSERNGLLNEAEQHLKRAVALDASFAEGHALLASVYGLMIANSPMKGMLLGSRAGSTLDRAVALAPDNPRVLVSQGVSKFNTPRMFGGSVGEAESLLKRALVELGKQAPDAAFPAWGRFDAHAWLGQVLASRGEVTGARAEYAKALEMAPRSGWIRSVLLPALDKKKK